MSGARVVTWDGEALAVLVEPDGGPRVLVPPVVQDEEGNVLMGAEVLAAIVETGVEVEHVVIRGCAPGDLAAIDQKVSAIADRLGVRISPP